MEEDPDEKLDMGNKGLIERAYRKQIARHCWSVFCSYNKIFEPVWSLKSKDSFGLQF